MFIVGTKARISDNSGAKTAQCIKVLGGKKVGKVGDSIIVSIKTVRNHSRSSKVKEGSLHQAIIIRTKKEFRRKDGTSISFDENSITLFKKGGQPLCTRLFGPVLYDLRKVRDFKILSLSSIIL